MMAKKRSKMRELAPLQVAFGEVAEFTIQELPLVRIRAQLVRDRHRGLVVEVKGIDCPLTIIPEVANVVIIDSNGR